MRSITLYTPNEYFKLIGVTDKKRMEAIFEKGFEEAWMELYYPTMVAENYRDGCLKSIEAFVNHLADFKLLELEFVPGTIYRLDISCPEWLRTTGVPRSIAWLESVLEPLRIKPWGKKRKELREMGISTGGGTYAFGNVMPCPFTGVFYSAVDEYGNDVEYIFSFDGFLDCSEEIVAQDEEGRVFLLEI